MSSAEFKRPGLVCEKCDLPFALEMFAVQDMESVETLPDPFPAKCPACQHQSTYPKSSIVGLVGAALH